MALGSQVSKTNRLVHMEQTEQISTHRTTRTNMTSITHRRTRTCRTKGTHLTNRTARTTRTHRASNACVERGERTLNR